MKRLRGWAVYGALLALAAAAALASRQSDRASELPSIDNPGPEGLRALYLYLKDTGHPILEGRAPLTALPGGTRTVVLPAPTARELDAAEVEALTRFVESGGTLVYLAPRAPAGVQPRLEAWLDVHKGAALKAAADPALAGVEDPGGASAAVWLPYGAATGLSRLRVSGDEGLGSTEGWTPVAGADGAAVVAWRKLGQGEVWVLAGPDLAENRRIELLDNLRFWEQLAAAGPMLFDEYHHREVAPPPLSNGILAFAAQLLACAGFFAYTRGTRLGPPRPEPTERHRSSLEYLHSLAWLTRRAGVEKELLAELDARLRMVLHERLGLSPTLPDDEVGRVLDRDGVLPASRFLAVREELRRALAAPRVGPREYLRLSRELAKLERRVTGRSVDL